MLNPDRLTVKSAEALNDALGRARRSGNPLVYDLHLLAALLDQDEGIVVPLVQKLGVNVTGLREATAQGVTGDALLEARRQVRGSHRVTDQSPEEKSQSLQRFSTALPERARRGKLDPVIGRDEEIRRVVQVLSRRTKNNPVLIGEPGEIGRAHV